MCVRMVVCVVCTSAGPYGPYTLQECGGLQVPELWSREEGKGGGQLPLTAAGGVPQGRGPLG
jgi:hypothetical protein